MAVYEIVKGKHKTEIDRLSKWHTIFSDLRRALMFNWSSVSPTQCPSVSHQR